MGPGVYTIEGLGQSGMLLDILLAVHQEAAARGIGAGEVDEALRVLARGTLASTFAPGARDAVRTAWGIAPRHGRASSRKPPGPMDL